jgi:uncharacterized protein YodC (DUF2158 family)
MKFRPGDLVIKNTGGNKMRIISYDNGGVQCGWITEVYHEDFFNEEELIPLSQYKSVLITEKRDDLIDQIIHDKNSNNEII